MTVISAAYCLPNQAGVAANAKDTSTEDAQLTRIYDITEGGCTESTGETRDD